MTNAAERMRRYRTRRRAGEIVMMIEADESALAQGLVAVQLLPPDLADDRTAIANATQRLIEIISKED